jgi:hypothetical protein
MNFATLPRQPEIQSAWPFRRAVLLWLAVSAALWVPIAFGAYWLLQLD